MAASYAPARDNFGYFAQLARSGAICGRLCLHQHPKPSCTNRQIKLPFMTSRELAREGQESDFWAKLEPETPKLEDPFISYYRLIILENDNLTRVVIGHWEI
jgi:hypothetical protein